MKVLSRLVAVALVSSAVVVVGSATPASACSCLAIDRTLERGELIGAAFVGSVVEAPDVSGGNSARLVTWTFRVEDVYRGELPPTVEVKAAASGVSCGFEGIGVGSRVGVILRREGDDWHSGLCSSGAPEKFAVLGAPSPPSADARDEPPATPATPATDDEVPTAVIVVAGAAAVCVALGAAQFTRRRRRALFWAERTDAGRSE